MIRTVVEAERAILHTLATDDVGPLAVAADEALTLAEFDPRRRGIGPGEVLLSRYIDDCL